MRCVGSTRREHIIDNGMPLTPQDPSWPLCLVDIKSGRFHPLQPTLVGLPRSHISPKLCLDHPAFLVPQTTSLPSHAKSAQKTAEMYTSTPTSRFLVLSAADSAPFNPNNKFLVLSPTESVPHDEQALIESSSTEQSPDLTPSNLHRTNSSSSTDSDDSRFNSIASTLPNRFLYLGNSKSRKALQ